MPGAITMGIGRRGSGLENPGQSRGEWEVKGGASDALGDREGDVEVIIRL